MKTSPTDPRISRQVSEILSLITFTKQPKTSTRQQASHQQRTAGDQTSKFTAVKDFTVKR